jgi:hypothetical protein
MPETHRAGAELCIEVSKVLLVVVRGSLIARKSRLWRTVLPWDLIVMSGAVFSSDFELAVTMMLAT